MLYSTQSGLPDMTQAHHILAIQPHYDDNDLGAGGTLAWLSSQGVKITYLTVTNDLVGVVDLSLADEIASSRLRHEQQEAGSIIGIKDQLWLGYPDAGDYGYFDLRRRIITIIRQLRPDFLFTCDPWLPYEAHHDHIQTGLAVCESSFLQGMPRLKSVPKVDSAYQPYEITGVALYFTPRPNTTVDISAFHNIKHAAIGCYETQFTRESMLQLEKQIEASEREAGRAAGFTFGESLKILSPAQLHIDAQTWQL